MAKKEAHTDYWVFSLLKDANINLEPQGSTVKEINEALRTASKSGSGNVGFPEFVGVIKDFIIVIEDKASTANHVKLNEKGLISKEINDIKNFSVNGALFYAQHLEKNTSYKKVIAFGISGNEKKHKISPLFVDETEFYRELPEVESFISFNEENIEEYYVREILKEDTDEEKESAEILKDASELHEDLRNYGNLKDIDKPLIVSGIMLALRESENQNFSIDNLTGDTVVTDGQKIFDAIEANLRRANVSPDVKKDKILSQFSIIKDTPILNKVNDKLHKTPLKHFAEFVNKKIYRSIRYSQSAEDYLGRFYGEFMSYSGGDGQSLGIILTPKHITELFCDLVDLSSADRVFDPCCGTGGFLISAMYSMLNQAQTDNDKKSIKQQQLHGIELQPYMFTIATTNMILRGDGKSNLISDNFLKLEPNKLQLKQATIGMMNPPYSQGSKQNPDLYELSFTEHLLNSLVVGGKCVVILPQSSMTGKTIEEQSLKENILKKHTLEGVITLNKDTFYGVGTTPCIAVFTAGETHPAEKICKFIDFRNDGFKVNPHIGLVETESAKDKKQHLLDVWFEKIDSETKFCVKTTIEPSDEWLHSYFYFDDNIPSFEEFEKTVGEYLSFEFSMIMHNKLHLFNLHKKIDFSTFKSTEDLNSKDWKNFNLISLFTTIQRGRRLTKANQAEGDTPYISSTAMNNGVDNFISNSKGVRIFSNCITIANSGSVGSSFYHPYKFIASDHVTHLKNESMNIFVYLFIASITNRLSDKYNFNREINDKRISRETILLPINEQGKPDYDFMEQYIRNIVITKYKKYAKK